MPDTTIEWTQKSWNPIVGCSIKSAGCTNCYAMPMAARLAAMGVDHYQGLTHKVNGNAVWTGKLALNEKALLEPLRRKKPTTYFVNSMGDLFHEDCPDEWIDRVFAVMALCPQHTFQVLTKRSDRMREYCLSRAEDPQTIISAAHQMDSMGGAELNAEYNVAQIDIVPLMNVWLGVSVEDQRGADERIPDLLATPAAIRWLSCEPLLGAVDLRDFIGSVHHHPDNKEVSSPEMQALVRTAMKSLGGGLIDWIVVGGESGKDARPMHPDWARSLRDQCAAADVPFFFKQWGDWELSLDREKDDPDWRADYSNDYVDHGKSRWLNFEGGRGFHGERFVVMRKVGKKKAGRLLDGVQHDAMPSSPNRGGGPAQPVEGRANIDRSPFPHGREKGPAR